jgi:RIO kinase 1
LAEVVDIEKDLKKQDSEVLYRTVAGITEAAGESSEEGEDEDSSSDDSDDDVESSKFVDCSRPRDESPSTKKERKKAIKDQQAEKRKSKVKKHVKKRKERLGAKKK